MTKEQYEKELLIIKNDYENNKRVLQKKFALENNSYKIGDVITDHKETIKIENIGLYIALTGLSECYYTGIKLKKDGLPYKSEETGRIYQSNIITK